MWEQLREEGKKSPLDYKPVVMPHLLPYWAAFTMLSSCCRGPAFAGVAPIPLSEMLVYCDLYGFVEQEERRDFVYYIRCMDAVFISKKNAKPEKLKGSST